MRTYLVVAVVLLSPLPSFAQTAPAPSSELRALSADELAALTPLARRGVAIVVRDAEAGVRAQTTIMSRAHAPVSSVHDVIAEPEHYGEFMQGIDRTQIESRFQNRVAFRLHTSAGLFSSDTVGSLHVVSAHRIDGVLSQSQLGPGDLRWDLYPDGDGTLVALTTRADPSGVNWVLRALTSGDPSAIAGLQMSYNGIIVSAVSRRAEILSGNSGHSAFEHADTAAAATEPPPAGPWMSLDPHLTVGAVVLDAGRDAIGSTVAMRVASSLQVVCARLENVAGYPRIWSMVRSISTAPSSGGSVRFGAVVESTLFHTEGDQELRIAPRDGGFTIEWRGLSRDYSGVSHRWDLIRAPNGGTVVMLTGGRELQGAGLVLRTAVGIAHWVVAGYSVAWKMLWIRPLVAGL